MKLNTYLFYWQQISLSSSIQFRKRGWPDLPHSTSNLSPCRSIHCISLFKPTLLLSFSTCDLHVFLGRPCFLFPFTSNSNLPFSKHAHHPSLTSARTISLHLPLPSAPLFSSIPTSPLGLRSSFSPSVSHQTLLSPSLFRFFSKLV